MGEDEVGGDKTDACSEVSGGPNQKPARGWAAVLSALLGLIATTISVIYRGSLLGTAALTEITHWLFLGLAVGWVCRSLIHGCIGYFRRSEEEGASTYGLLLVSVVNAVFSIAWLSLAILMLTKGCDPLMTAVTTAIVCLTSFLLALATHRAAKKAQRPRASECVSAKLRDPLDPGKSTPIGWPLVKLIEWRSPPHLLSTYVGGSLATLLIVLALTASAALSEDTKEGPQQSTPKAQQSGAGGFQMTYPKVSGSISPKLAGLQAGAPRETIDLFCFPVEVTHHSAPARSAAPQVTYFCVIVSNDQLTNEYLVLVPSPVSSP